MQAFFKCVQTFAASIYTGKTKAEPVLTSATFRLHYPFNVVILCVLAVFATFQISGDPIQCSVDEAVSPDVMNSYCWIQSTYTLPRRLGDAIGTAVISPGVGGPRAEHEPVRYHKYYQWVVFFLVFQALLFYIPFYIWKSFEDGRMEMLLVDGEKENRSPKDKDKELDFSRVTEFLSKNFSNNDHYFRVFIFCEILNFANVIGQIFFIDRFLGYEFTTYGTRVLEFLDQDVGRTDPMDAIFPKVTKCVFRKFGPTGNIVNYDGLCVLALNIFHEKIFIFLWFWLIILAFITGLGVIWRLIILSSHKARTLLLQRKVLNFSRHPELTNDPRYDAIHRLPSINNPKFDAIETIMQRQSAGDWFILYQLSKNMWPHNYKTLIRKLAIEFGWKEPKED